MVKKNEEICSSNGEENYKNELIGEVQRKLNIFEGKNEDGNELIVCATLINKAANLGGKLKNKIKIIYYFNRTLSDLWNIQCANTLHFQ